jgi:hypothetical protein
MPHQSEETTKLFRLVTCGLQKFPETLLLTQLYLIRKETGHNPKDTKMLSRLGLDLGLSALVGLRQLKLLTILISASERITYES